MIYLIIISLITTFSFSALVEQSDANIVAQNVYKEFSKRNIDSFNINNISEISEGDNILIYVYHLNPKGFILISADDRSIPYLAYSFDNNFTINGIPDNISWALENYKNNIQNKIINNLDREYSISSLWDKYLSDDVEQNRDRDVSPLMDAEFDQSGAWNNALSEFGFYGPVGCVAVSMAQIMHYWSYPEQGEGSNSYYEDDYGVLEIDFSQAFYDYDNMAATYATSASQTLLYHSGIAVNMDYDNSGSGAYVIGSHPSALYAMEHFFLYSDQIGSAWKDNMGTTDFRILIQEQLDNSLPVIYSGFGAGYGGGHAWNVDGYQGNNLHCNWGWGGWNNGYYNLTSMGGFPDDQVALVDLIPEPYTNPIALFEYEVENNSVTFIDLSEIINESEIETWNWNFGDGNTESNSYGFTEHTYDDPGIYEVTLSVTNIYGQSGDTHVEYIDLGSCTAGDVNSDDIINILDIVMLVNFVLNLDSPDGSEECAADINSDGILNILDVVTLVNTILG